MAAGPRKPQSSSPLSRRPDRLTFPVRARKSVHQFAYGENTPGVTADTQPAESNGYFAFKTEFLGADRVLDVYYDYAPPERVTNYPGYLDLTRVEWNGVILWTDEEPTKGALTEQDLKLIVEEIEGHKAPDDTYYETADERL
jgi:hypothetical protein